MKPETIATFNAFSQKTNKQTDLSIPVLKKQEGNRQPEQNEKKEAASTIELTRIEDRADVREL